MTVLAALDRRYARLLQDGDVAPVGYSREKISFCLVLSAEGTVGEVHDLRLKAQGDRPVMLPVPACVRRTTDLTPNFLWDKTAYALGLGAALKLAEAEHAAFVTRHRALLAHRHEPGFIALLRFLDLWRPDQWERLKLSESLSGSNVVFRLEGDPDFLHDTEGARALAQARALESGEVPAQACLVTGEVSPTIRLHPVIKGVIGTPAIGASLVSFNQDSANSYGKRQGANAPISIGTAARCAAALNRMLELDSPNRLRTPLGNATCVFWAEPASDAAPGEAERSEAYLAGALDGAPSDAASTSPAEPLREHFEALGEGRVPPPLPPPHPQTRLNVLGLSPNAGRLWVRYWLREPASHFTARLEQHASDTAISPAPWRRSPSIAYLVKRSTERTDRPDAPDSYLVGPVLASALSGAPYPQAWLTAAVERLKTGDVVGIGWRVAAIRAVLQRTAGRGRQGSAPRAPEALDRLSTDPPYNLGRLFATVEAAQRRALGVERIRRRFVGSACATPARVFPALLHLSQFHFAKLRRRRRDISLLESEIDHLTRAFARGFPVVMNVLDQGAFFIGYYHQRSALIRARAAASSLKAKTQETA